MSEVIVLNGPPGVGKSTVLAELRRLVPGSVAIGGDELRAFAPADARAHLGGGATYRAGGVLAGAYLAMGGQLVIFDYVFLRAAHFRYFSEGLPEATVVKVFTLWAPLSTVMERDRERTERQRIGPGARECYLEMQHNLGIMGQIVDNTAGDPGRAAAHIHELSSAAVARL